MVADDIDGSDPGDHVVAELVRAAAAGRDAAWNELVARFSGLIWSVVRGYRLDNADAADVFQNTWLRLTEYLDRIENPERVGSWLATTARREALRMARGSSRTVPTADLEVLGVGRAVEPTPEEDLLEQEQAVLDAQRNQQVWACFEELSERCQRLLRVLLAVPPPSYTEAAAALDMPVGSVGPTRGRCLRHLRDRLADRGITDRLARS